jgi:hypothetical protein
MRAFGSWFSSVWMSLKGWRPFQSRTAQYRVQAEVVADWVASQVRLMLQIKPGSDLDWDISHFSLYLARAIAEELGREDGILSIVNTESTRPIPIFARALTLARINQRRVVNSIPCCRIRIVPGWVKAYSLEDHEAAPKTLQCPD